MLMLGEVHTIACMLFVLQVHARLGSGRRQDGDDVHQAVVMARQQLEAAEAAAAADRQAVADALAAAAAAADPPHKAQDKGVCSQVPHLRPVEIAAAQGADPEPAVAGHAPSTQVFLSLPPLPEFCPPPLRALSRALCACVGVAARSSCLAQRGPGSSKCPVS